MYLNGKAWDFTFKPEVRAIQMPDGTNRDFELIQPHWSSVDFMAKVHAPLKDQIACALIYSRRLEIDLDTALAYQATQYHRHMIDKHGFSWRTQPGICPLFARRKRNIWGPR